MEPRALCRAEVQQQFADGGLGDSAERRRNRERRRAQLAQLDAGLAPVAELLGRVKGVDPPDYGSFDVRYTEHLDPHSDISRSRTLPLTL